MSVFQRRSGPAGEALHVDSVAVPDIVRAVGTPVYLYSRRYFERRYQALTEALAGCGTGLRVCYAVKANSNLAVLGVFAELGAGFDIVSGGELSRVMAVGGDPAKVVFSGVGKSTEELDLALKLRIDCFNVESVSELTRIAARAELLSIPARIAVRVNPDVDAATHPYISTGLKENKFGVPAATALALYRTAAAHPWLSPVGIACHIGSQIGKPEPMLEALKRLLDLVDALAAEGIELTHVDLGGGFGVRYRDEAEFDIAAYGARVRSALQGRQVSLSVEPGRFLVANGGLLVTRVEYLKPAEETAGKQFVVVDAAMNDLIRPALYQAWHGVEPVAAPGTGAVEGVWDVVGPVCESGDFLARDRHLTVAPGDLLAITSAGAYGMVQSSNYNTRPRPAEVLVDGERFRVVRRRETAEDLYRLELPARPEVSE
ncbi:MAG: diaminopimelate decarboxylase [Pseudomonadales bacterium]